MREDRTDRETVREDRAERERQRQSVDIYYNDQYYKQSSLDVGQSNALVMTLVLSRMNF